MRPDSATTVTHGLSPAETMTAQFAETILDRANDSVTYVRRCGRRSIITRFEAAVLQLANGQVRGRRLKTAFVDMVLAAARHMEVIDREETLTGKALREANENGTIEEFEVEHARYLDALPKVHELSEAELIAAYQRLQLEGYIE